MKLKKNSNKIYILLKKLKKYLKVNKYRTKSVYIL